MKTLPNVSFPSKEHDVLRVLPHRKKKEAFFNGWTRKEAYIKATGDGMACPLDQFDVSLTPGEPARLLSIKEDKHAAACWSIYELLLVPGYKAALAVELRDLQLSCWKWGNNSSCNNSNEVHKLDSDQQLNNQSLEVK